MTEEKKDTGKKASPCPGCTHLSWDGGSCTAPLELDMPGMEEIPFYDVAEMERYYDDALSTGDSCGDGDPAGPKPGVELPEECEAVSYVRDMQEGIVGRLDFMLSEDEEEYSNIRVVGELWRLLRDMEVLESQLIRAEKKALQPDPVETGGGEA